MRWNAIEWFINWLVDVLEFLQPQSTMSGDPNTDIQVPVYDQN